MCFTCAGLKIENKRYNSILIYPHKQQYSTNSPALRSTQVQFFRELGLWFLPIDNEKEEKLCSSPDEMTSYVNANGGSLLDKCCVTGAYWRTSSV